MPMTTGSPTHDEKRAVLIGDVVNSRKFPDQEGLLRRIEQILDWTNRKTEPSQPLQITIGDEFQAAYRGVDDVLWAALLLRLKFIGFCDIRLGFGCGTIVTYDKSREPLGQSGTAWWAGREALDIVKRAQRRKKHPKSLRSWIVSEDQRMMGLVNAYLACQDQILSQLNQRDAVVVLAALDGRRQQDVADELQIKQGSVSDRNQETGAYALLLAHRQIEAALQWKG
jgi:hypothetical protein